MKWVLQSEDDIMSSWLKSCLDENCPTCKSPIANGYNNNNECTRRVCTNEACPRTIASRISDMCVLLGINGIKEGNGYKLVKDHKLTNWFDAIPYICTEKPKVTLPTFMRLSFIFGMNDVFDRICDGCFTIDEAIGNANNVEREILLEKKELLEYGLTKFELVEQMKVVKAFDPIISGLVVITGEVPGYKKREDFIPIVNSTFLGLANFTYSESKRKTGLFCCISQDKNSTTGKVTDAKEAGRPIYNKDEFISLIVNRIKEKGKFEEYIKVFNERRSTE